MTRIDGTGQVAGAYRRAQQRTATLTATAAEETPVAVAAIVPATLPPHVRDAFATLLGETDDLRRSLAQARLRIDELEKLVDRDSLTPVLNRRGLLRDLGRTLAEVERHGLSAAFIFIDVDRLKQLNDTYGHVAGDAALVYVAEALLTNFRESDTIARLGGDEFAVILRRVDETQARMKTRQLMTAVAQNPLRLRSHDVHVSISAGFHMLRPRESPQSVLTYADRAMYAVKSDGA